jgi:uncharacterized protein YjbJ (UPF0337 family)
VRLAAPGGGAQGTHLPAWPGDARPDGPRAGGVPSLQIKEDAVNRDQIKGKIDEIKGDVKKRIGGATDDPKKQGEGLLEETGGKIRKGVGNLEEGADKRRDPDRDT